MGATFTNFSNGARGLGAVLIVVGAIGLLIAGFAERRTVPYIAALDSSRATSPLS